MNVYVAGQLADVSTVREVMTTVVAAGHAITLDWTTQAPAAAAVVAAADLGAVMAADAVLAVASGPEPGRGLFVELGAALARAELGLLAHVVAIGPIAHESVFWHHPRVQRVDDVREWLSAL